MSACPTHQKEFQLRLSIINGENDFELDPLKPIHILHDTGTKQTVYGIKPTPRGVAVEMQGKAQTAEASLKIHAHNTAWT